MQLRQQISQSKINHRLWATYRLRSTQCSPVPHCSFQNSCSVSIFSSLQFIPHIVNFFCCHFSIEKRTRAFNCCCCSCYYFVSFCVFFWFNKRCDRLAMQYKLLYKCGDIKHSYAPNNFVQRRSIHFDTDTVCHLINASTTEEHRYTLMELLHSLCWPILILKCTYLYFVSFSYEIIFVCKTVDLVERSPLHEICAERTSTEYWYRFLHKSQTKKKFQRNFVNWKLLDFILI